jgi:hypothetical protein
MIRKRRFSSAVFARRPVKYLSSTPLPAIEMDDVRTAVERCGAAAGLLTTSADDVATSAEVRMNRMVSIRMRRFGD